MSDFKEYKIADVDYNVQSAVDNLKQAYWSNEPKKVAEEFTKAEDIIIGAICHFEYTVCKPLPQGKWIPVSERLPDKEGRCIVSTDYGNVTMDSFVDGIFVLNLGSVIAWQPLPEPYKGADNDKTN